MLISPGKLEIWRVTRRIPLTILELPKLEVTYIVMRMSRYVTWKLLVSSYLGLARVSLKYHLHNLMTCGRVDGGVAEVIVELNWRRRLWC